MSVLNFPSVRWRRFGTEGMVEMEGKTQKLGNWGTLDFSTCPSAPTRGRSPGPPWCHLPCWAAAPLRRSQSPSKKFAVFQESHREATSGNRGEFAVNPTGKQYIALSFQLHREHERWQVHKYGSVAGSQIWVRLCLDVHALWKHHGIQPSPYLLPPTTSSMNTENKGERRGSYDSKEHLFLMAHVASRIP